MIKQGNFRKPVQVTRMVEVVPGRILEAGQQGKIWAEFEDGRAEILFEGQPFIHGSREKIYLLYAGEWESL